ncbi:unnamed protein product [Mytilus coruscus]|uniref:SAM domain-containing protein n=1 Tax=Mytilus coruscus TaxID=42192 RepID=A0A6J8F347_MYTCO|nr:unnamed protein product [Mytilus coruscus]
MKLSEDTANTILELGFENMEAVSLIEANDLAETNMPIGQRKLLLRAVEKTFRKDISAEKVDMAASKRRTCAQEEGEHGHASCVNKDGGARSLIQDGGAHSFIQDGGNQQEDGYIQAVLQQLAVSQKQHEHSPDPISVSYNLNMNKVNSNISWQDPQSYLKSANIDCKIVYNDISDFVSYDIGGTSMSEERLISDTSGGQLVFKSGPLILSFSFIM